MQDHDKTNEQVIDQLTELRFQLAELKASQAGLLENEIAYKKSEERTHSNLSGLISSDHPIEKEEFAKVINIPEIQSLMDDFYRLTNIGVGILDLKGNILVATGWQDICTKYHRVHPETLRNCIESDLHLTENVKEGEYFVYKCKNKMWDMMTPIVMGGLHVANLYLGQFLFEDEVVDLDVFAEQAERYGFAKDEYLAALNRAPRWSREKVHAIMAFYSKFASMIGRLSYNNLKLANALIETKIVEEALRDSESHFRSLVETIPDALVVYDGPGRVTFVNKAFEQLYGWSTEELVGKHLSNFVPPSEKEITKQSWERTLKGEKVVFESKRWNKEGKALDLQISTAILRNMDGIHTASIVIHRDITGTKRAQEELHKSQRTLNTVVTTSPVGIGLVLDGKITWLNDLGLKMFGFENQQEIIGRSTRIVYPSDEEYERVGRDLYNDLEGGKTAEIVTRFSRKDGSIFDGRLRLRPVDPSSSENLMVFVITDITDQIIAEQEKESLRTQLIQSQKLEALGTLVGGIAHDFNNMLQIMIGYSQLLLGDKKNGEPGYKELQTIIETGLGGAELVRKLLAFGQQSQVIPAPLDLNQQIIELNALISRTLPHLVQVDLDLADGATKIRADRNQIDLVLMSLVMNASEAMPNGGRLKIATTSVSLDEEYCRRHHEVKPGNYVELLVADTGCGMDDKTLSRIFEPFFSTKQRGSTRGTGLGLSVVQGVVQQQGGHITCESEPGIGTQFKIYFPAIEAALMTGKTDAPAVESVGAETI
jgi:two-component system, cell cycle sensor histidine kinase and response regulator CckA